VETTRRHAEIEGDDEVELPLRRRIAPRHLAGLLAAHFAEILALQAVPRAEEMAQKVFVSLARRSEQVRAPDKQIAREVSGFVRILAGHSQAAFLQTGDDMILGCNS